MGLWTQRRWGVVECLAPRSTFGAVYSADSAAAFPLGIMLTTIASFDRKWVKKEQIPKQLNIEFRNDANEVSFE